MISLALICHIQAAFSVCSFAHMGTERQTNNDIIGTYVHVYILQNNFSKLDSLDIWNYIF